MGSKTPLHQTHLDAGARMVDFGGWDMPLHYGSQLGEHHAVREKAGLFDVSHMTIVDVEGGRSRDFLRALLANDVARLGDNGKALYTCMLNEAGGVIDDLIVYLRSPDRYRLVVNAATRDKDLAWIRGQSEQWSPAIEERKDLAMIAIQGPRARELATAAIDEASHEAVRALPPFAATEADGLFVARTGYTGEDGFEIMVAADRAPAMWRSLVSAGAVPCGLGARDTLRLEAGLNLYGNDMDETTSPLEAGLGWTIAWEPDERMFVGRDALLQVRARRDRQRFAGLLLEGRGVLRNHQRIVVDGHGEGEVTSGGFSPTLERSIALARLPAGDYDVAKVDIRGRLEKVRIVKPPFVRHGQARIDL